MPEIIPNWHPAAVHFPIALTVTATLLLLAGRLRPAATLLQAGGRLLLQLAALSAVATAALGWHAYLTVEHDAAGHLVMLRHRDWALAGTGGLLLLALWDALRQRAGKELHAGGLAGMLVISGSMGFTGWLGGEMVYRHGIGVSSAAFVSPVAVVEAAPKVQPENPLPAAPSPAAAPGEHVHKDGKRHRH
ncbi:MAG: DUF2231 domain-containing protein [Dechloromonas sp.]|nr:DUF2231 domain-containing protein [Dechloromonas sp.]